MCGVIMCGGFMCSSLRCGGFRCSSIRYSSIRCSSHRHRTLTHTHGTSHRRVAIRRDVLRTRLQVRERRTQIAQHAHTLGAQPAVVVQLVAVQAPRVELAPAPVAPHHVARVAPTAQPAPHAHAHAATHGLWRRVQLRQRQHRAVLRHHRVRQHTLLLQTHIATLHLHQRVPDTLFLFTAHTPLLVIARHLTPSLLLRPGRIAS